MFSELLFTFVILLVLGLFHGINPGMGWLFAVSLGLQEQRRAAVWSALLPLALGHALAIGVTLLLVGIIGLVIPFEILKWIVAAILITFGIYKLIRNRHPRYGGMQVNFRQLTIWSFLMASAHGAGLMVLPFLFSDMTTGSAMASSHMHGHEAGVMVDHASHATVLSNLPTEPLIGILVILVHTIGYLLIMGIIAVIVYEKLGLRLLKSAWFNIDLIWAAALILSGVLVPLI
ncbi:hypothetical protein NC796_00740 [Aliifodinibius sp. S!AR15-10]|uniref:hypothetical protein n=1 Tax=Aliifodinibius sp. S!AR15-10 TaxID=2950437 RepID=UPI00285C912B|nr:hypothetical protein [Aliifodinibius sp. S!AR15-10]MDR8389641.1 hypothetical protein [Aliifodinibius sp. S!AR15-10]